MPISLANFLKLYGIDPSATRIKILRHRAKNLELMKRDGLLEEYQQFQSKQRLKGAEYALSFLAYEATSCVLFGLFKVIAVQTRKAGFEHPTNELLRYDPDADKCEYRYRLQKQSLLSEFEERLVIDWKSVGSSAESRIWHQWLHKQDKPILELKPEGYVKDFPGFERILLTRTDLEKLFRASESPANRVWKQLMCEVAAVYLITTSDGRQYVGSAYGDNGLWGRWKTYSDSPSGGNHLLRRLIDGNPAVVSELTYSVLQTLPHYTSKEDVIALEGLYKRKLGSRAHGLNAN